MCRYSSISTCSSACAMPRGKGPWTSPGMPRWRQSRASVPPRLTIGAGSGRPSARALARRMPTIAWFGSAHRFFRRWFFAFCDEESVSLTLRGRSVEGGEMQQAEANGRPHDPVAKRGDAPAARARDLGDQPIDVEAVEQPADLGTVLSGIPPEPIGQRGTEVAVREAVHGVLPAHEGQEELGVWPGHGIERLDGAVARGVLARGDGVQPA